MAGSSSKTLVSKTEVKYADCSRVGCNGRCPIKVIAHKIATDTPAVCKECGKKYPCPTWAKARFGMGAKKPTTSKPNAGNRVEAELAKMRQQMADLLKAQQPKPPKVPNGIGDPKPLASKSADLQTILDLAKGVGNEELVKSTQKALDEAKASENKKIPLTSMVKKLEHGRKKRDQAASKVAEIRQKLATAEAAALEAALEYCQLSDEYDKVLKEEGRIQSAESKGLGATGNILPSPPSLSEEKQAEWNQIAAQVTAKVALEVRALFEAANPGMLDSGPQAMAVDGTNDQGRGRQRSASEEPPHKVRSRTPRQNKMDPPEAPTIAPTGVEVSAPGSTPAKGVTEGDLLLEGMDTGSQVQATSIRSRSRSASSKDDPRWQRAQRELDQAISLAKAKMAQEEIP